MKISINTRKALLLIIISWISVLGTSLALIQLVGADNFLWRCLLIWPFSMAAYHSNLIIWRHFRMIDEKKARLARLNHRLPQRNRFN